MLFDPKWGNKEPSLEGIIAWLETQPPETPYEFMNCKGQCLIGQYMTSIGIVWNHNSIKGSSYNQTLSKIGDGTFSTQNILEAQRIASNHPHTFGAALERARAKLQNRR